MKRARVTSVLFLLLFLNRGLAGQEYKTLPDHDGLNRVSAESGISAPVNVYVVYDNYVSAVGTKADWGFSLVIRGLDKSILFDTGTKPEIFESNFRFSGIDPSEIGMLVISHEHGDHTGGIPAFAKMNKGIPALMPHSFSESFKKNIISTGFTPLLADGPAMICEHLYTSGEFKYIIAEQALVLDTHKGLIVMTGCSHPGIIEMLNVIKNEFGKNIYMVFGGFHLMGKTEKQMNDIISGMKDLGVIKCGATHCTGDKQIEMFRKAFGENYISLGTGNRIVIE